METLDVQAMLDAEEQRLLRVRAVLTGHGLGASTEADEISELSHVDQHPADVASEVFEREWEQSLFRRVEAELDDLQRARQRLAAGRYGRCDSCGATIDDERLRAIPTARFCPRHAVEWEADLTLPGDGGVPATDHTRNDR